MYENEVFYESKEVFFDGSNFDPTGDMETYAKSFAVKSLKGWFEK